MNRPTTIKLPPLATVTTNMKSRGRSGSIVKVEEVGDKTTEEILDRSAYVNINANWVNAKGEFRSLSLPLACTDEWAFQGAWLIHVVLILLGKIIMDIIPGMTQQISWTMVNLCYLAVCTLSITINFEFWPCSHRVFSAHLLDVPLGYGNAFR